MVFQLRRIASALAGNATVAANVEDEFLKAFLKISIPVLLFATAVSVPAAQLSTDARTAVPHDVQQLVAIDYQAMENSPAAMNLRDRVMPPELKRLEDALNKSGLNENHDVEDLDFVLFRGGSVAQSGAKPGVQSGAKPGVQSGDDNLDTVGIAQGQFSLPDILASFRKQKVKPTLVRTNKIYPLAKTGMVVCFVDPSTMVFGDLNAVKQSLDARDGLAPNMLKNQPIMDAMNSVDSEPLWSILDQKGTQTMMKQVLSQAGTSSTTDIDTLRKRLQASWYSMDFQHGVKFDLTIATGDSFSAATLSSLMSAGLMVRKMSGTDSEKQALSATTISSIAGNLSIHFATTNDGFNSLLQSPLFHSMVR